MAAGELTTWGDPEGGDDPLHRDVGAYALGVLDDWEAALFEAHLRECARCREQLDSLVPTAVLLSEADGEAVRELEHLHLTDQLLAATRAERGRQRRRQLIAVAAGVSAIVLAAGASLAAGARWLGDSPPATVSGQPWFSPHSPAPFGPGIGGPDLMAGEQFSAIDTSTGVRVDLLVTTTESGSQLAVALANLPGPATGRLVVVDADGAAEPSATWQVPAHGYGTGAHPAPLLLHTVTATGRADLREIRIEALESHGPVTLVTLTF